MSDARAADVIARSLALAGVRHVFTYPGETIVDLLDACRVEEIDVVLARREASAAFMAEGLAMATGGVGACLSTLGPGSTALANGVASATLDRVPMIALSGQIDSGREQYFTHQVVDHDRLYAPITKWAGRIEPSAVATTMRRALRVLPADVSGRPAIDGEAAAPPMTPAAVATTVFTTGPEPGAVLAAARRPVILAGIGAVRAGATPALVRLAETVSTPVVVAPMAKGVFPEDHPLFAGVLDMACSPVLRDLLDSADLIVTAGFDPVELINPWTLRTPVLHVDAIPNVDQIYASDCECVGDVGAMLGWLADGWRGEPRWTEQEVGRHRGRLRDAYYSGRVAGRLNPTDVVDAVRRAAPRQALVTTDVGSHKLLVGQGWRAYEPRSVLMTNGLSSMGFGVPAAIAAKVADPARPVVAMVGDGGFAMTATEVRLAAALSLPVVFVVFVDGSLNRIELTQRARGIPSTATRIEDVDLVKLAESMDCDGVRAADAAELEKSLQDLPSLTRPLVVEARIDPTQYDSQF
jgi:acetolactate synthase-1/2/3 large subunit